MISIRYIGRRILGEKIFHAYLHEKEEVFFAGSKFVRVGEWYEARFTKKDGLQLKTRPMWKDGPKATEEEINKWEAEDLLATREIKSRNFAKKMQTHPAILECGERLKPLVKGLGYSRKKEIVEYIMDYLEKEERAKWEESIKKVTRRLVKNARKGR